jgi:eukaryotic-like serine/threonine-protein kinase
MDETFLTVQRALAGEYSLEREIGRGGMGVVYLAREVQLDRLVAIKVLPRVLIERADVRERFVREARTAAGLSHPNIVPIHRVGEAEGLPYFVMTYIRGETLGERLRTRGPLTPTALSKVMHDVALALGYAHGRGVVHRDVKPDNILLEEESGRAIVSDFGIARAAGDARDESVMGTTHFMSPEQARGDAVDGRSDIYSLGIVAFLAATGRLPGETLSLSGVHGNIARVIERCIRLEPSERFRTAEDIASAIDASATPARAAIPEVIRAWTSHAPPLVHVYAFWSAGWIMAAAGQFLRLAGQRDYARFALVNGFIGLAFAAIPILPIAIYQLRTTQRALAAGYTLPDLRQALREWTAKRREELAAAAESSWARLARGVTWAAAIGVPTAILALDYAAWNNPRPVMSEAIRYSVLGLGGAGVASLIILGALGLPLVSPSIQRGLAGKLRGWLWNSRLGKLLADHLTPANRGVPETEFRPTELALKLAVDDLYAALPESFRGLVGDLPAVALRLSDHVTELRREVERVDVIRSNARGEEQAMADGLLASSRRQLGQVVTALEQMRLELLRLHGGADDVRALTTSLDSARAMVEDLVRLRGAETELDPKRRALPIDLRTPSPA